MRRLPLLFAMLLVVAACGEASSTSSAPAAPVTVGPGTTSSTTLPPLATTVPAAPLAGLAVEVVAEGLDRPVLVTAPPRDERLFILEQSGAIRLVVDGELMDRPFLDLTGEASARSLEQGLLGLAFHPGYAGNGRFFVYYTDRQGTSRLAEYRVSDDPDVGDPSSGELLLSVEQPAGNHNGGMLTFGPDGYLYLALGDGGGANDQFGHGQRSDTLLGTLLRLDVDGAAPYAIPPDNPFVAGGGAAEVWAYGLRNPWRIAFDVDEELLYIGDVGQARWEEVDVVPAAAGGLNYGWPILEGNECFQADSCDAAGTTMPALVYDHGEGCSIIGGYVYRGVAIPELSGHFFYGDWCTRWVRSFRYEAGVATDQRDWTAELGSFGQILSFGTDGFGELYITTSDGIAYRVVPVR